MASGLAVLLIAGLVALVVVGATVLAPASSGQIETEISSEAIDAAVELPVEASDSVEALDETEVEASINTAGTDADGDGIDERHELRQGTDPANPNTDGDRYRDNEDSAPLSKNSADVKIIVSDLESQENYDAIDSGMLDQEALATVTIDMIIKNDGDDYASFVKFDGVFLMDGVELKRATKEIGRIDAGESIEKHLTYTLRVIDVPQDAMNEIKNKIDDNIPPVISFEIQNLVYEKF